MTGLVRAFLIVPFLAHAAAAQGFAGAAGAQIELYHVAVDVAVDPVGRVTKLNGPMTAGGDVLAFRVTPDGGSVVYQANQDDVDAVELHLSRLPSAREAALGR